MGEDLARYPGGSSQRDANIVAGAGRSAAELASDLDSQGRVGNGGSIREECLPLQEDWG